MASAWRPRAKCASRIPTWEWASLSKKRQKRSVPPETVACKPFPSRRDHGTGRQLTASIHWTDRIPARGQAPRSGSPRPDRILRNPPNPDARRLRQTDEEDPAVNKVSRYQRPPGKPRYDLFLRALQHFSANSAVNHETENSHRRLDRNLL